MSINASRLLKHLYRENMTIRNFIILKDNNMLSLEVATEQALNKIDPQNAQVIRMGFDINWKKVNQVAAEIKKSSKTVKRRRAAGFKQLRSQNPGLKLFCTIHE